MRMLLLGCQIAEESYQTTGTIYVQQSVCVEEVTFSSQYDAVHLLGVEVCSVACEPAPYIRAGGSLIVECEPGDTVRARFLQLDLGI